VFVVYVSDTKEGVTDGDYLIDDECFMDEAERQGNVYSLIGFQEAFNNDEIHSTLCFIRIINVPLNN